MSRSAEMFAQLLTEGIHTIKIRQFKSIKIIQDELGYALGKEKGGVSIEYWRKGHIPSDLSDVEKLGQEIVRRANLGREWFQPFLRYAGYPDPAALANRVFAGGLSYSEPQAINRLPYKTHRDLVGRETLLKEIMQALRHPSGPWTVAIDGLGGMGKTTLALEIAKRCLQTHLFDAVVWSRVTDQGNQAHEPLTFDAILDTIAFQLGQTQISQLKGVEKARHVRALLRQQRVLIVLNNLETAGKSQAELTRRLQSLLGPSKALLTSRHRFLGEVYAIHLSGLNEDEAVRFVCQEAEEQGIKCIEAAKSDELKRIAGATGGSPLALKLIVGQLGHLPLEIVLYRLSTAPPLEDKWIEDQYARFYQFIYMPSWRVLSNKGKRLLLAMTESGRGMGAKFETLKSISGLSDQSLVTAIDELWRLSFLEVGQAQSLRNVHYHLHTLTQYFVLSNIGPRELNPKA